MFELLQRPQSRLHKSILFLIAFDGSDQFTGIAESSVERIPERLGLRQKTGGLIGFVGSSCSNRRRTSRRFGGCGLGYRHGSSGLSWSGLRIGNHRRTDSGHLSTGFDTSFFAQQSPDVRTAVVLTAGRGLVITEQNVTEAEFCGSCKESAIRVKTEFIADSL
jgi:hypothetical protein